MAAQPNMTDYADWYATDRERRKSDTQTDHRKNTVFRGFPARMEYLYTDM